MARDAHMLCTFMAMFTQSDHPIVMIVKWLEGRAAPVRRRSRYN